MIKNYFVGFTYWRKNGDIGIASTAVARDSPVSGWDDILEIMNTVCDKNPDFSNVVVNNW
jgi:hypothetical protein